MMLFRKKILILHYQLLIIGSLSILILSLKWKDLFLIFFDEAQAQLIGLKPEFLKLVFFALLSLSCVAALQTVGAFLVVAMLITPGATAYLLTDKFQKLLIFSVLIGSFSSFLGAYLSFFINGATGGIIVLLQTGLFFIVFFLAPKHGYWSGKYHKNKPRSKS